MIEPDSDLPAGYSHEFREMVRVRSAISRRQRPLGPTLAPTIMSRADEVIE